MMKSMEKMMDKLFVVDTNQMKNKNEPQVRNPNFRRQQGPHVPQSCQGFLEIQMNRK